MHSDERQPPQGATLGARREQVTGRDGGFCCLIHRAEDGNREKGILQGEFHSYLGF